MTGCSAEVSDETVLARCFRRKNILTMKALVALILPTQKWTH
jgi:hypothetical protein